MSAFICGEDHFKALAIFAASRTNGYGTAHFRVDPRYVEGIDLEAGPVAVRRGLHDLTSAELASLYAEVLYQENIRSVRARYPGDKKDELPGPIIRSDHIVVSTSDVVQANYRLKPVAILKMCDCLEYQSCETEDYRQTIAYRLLEQIRRAAIRELAGYEDAPWDYAA